MARLERLQKELKAIERDIEISKQLRPSKEVLVLKRRLNGQLSFVKRQITKLTSSKEEQERERQERVGRANKNRSVKMRTSWRYFKAIQKNWVPDKSSKEIRSLFKKHRQGLKTVVPEIAWINPSP